MHFWARRWPVLKASGLPEPLQSIQVLLTSRKLWFCDYVKYTFNKIILHYFSPSIYVVVAVCFVCLSFSKRGYGMSYVDETLLLNFFCLSIVLLSFLKGCRAFLQLFRLSGSDWNEQAPGLLHIHCHIWKQCQRLQVSKVSSVPWLFSLLLTCLESLV